MLGKKINLPKAGRDVTHPLSLLVAKRIHMGAPPYMRQYWTSPLFIEPATCGLSSATSLLHPKYGSSLSDTPIARRSHVSMVSKPFVQGKWWGWLTRSCTMLDRRYPPSPAEIYVSVHACPKYCNYYCNYWYTPINCVSTVNEKEKIYNQKTL